MRRNEQMHPGREICTGPQTWLIFKKSVTLKKEKKKRKGGNSRSKETSETISCRIHESCRDPDSFAPSGRRHTEIFREI